MSTLKVNAIVDASGGDTSTINSGTPVSTTSTQVAKAWVNFNGTGTVAIREQYNVSSITDNGTGQYTVNFTTAMPDENYAASGSASNSANNNNPRMVSRRDNQTYSASAFSFFCANVSQQYQDCLTIGVIFFR